MSFREPRAPGAPAQGDGIPLCAPALGGNAWRYLKECLDSGWVSSAGPFVTRFEHELAALVGRRYAVATASGTAALHLALLVAGVGPDEEVLAPALTFIAPINAVRYVGAWPVLIDAEPRYWQIDPDKLAEFLQRECVWRGGALRNRSSGRRVRALLPVHLLGHPADMAPLRDLASRHGLALIEDAAESLGARYRGVPVGSFGDLACLSFNGNKLITAGGGGALLADDAEQARRVHYLSTQAKDDPVEYQHGAVGYNYRLTNLQAALGVAQLEQLEAHIAAKRRIAQRYSEALGQRPGITPMAEAPWAFSTCWMYTVLIDQARYGIDSRALLRALEQGGIVARPLWRPVYTNQPYTSCQTYRCEVAPQLVSQALSLPCSVGLTEAEQERVIAAVLAAR
ncbi:MAG TPA: LegC family aminotransferase [Roseiflexaceae bacterium]|nr:LegC family aminotransferase [Roseiflexaceae bacterium]